MTKNIRRFAISNSIPVLSSLLLLSLSTHAGQFDTAVKGFEKSPEYVRPAATILGTICSSGWNRSAGVPEEWFFSLSLPLNITVLADKDRSYSGTYIDEGLMRVVPAVRARSDSEADALVALAHQSFTAPTIFGRDPAPTLHNYITDSRGIITDTPDVMYSDGIENFAKFNWFPSAFLQATLSGHFTELRLRWAGVPTKKLGIIIPGIGVQHDLHSTGLTLPVDLSLFTDITFPMLNWRPGGDISGRVTMRSSVLYTGFIIGKSFGPSDIMLEAGWEHSRLKTGGELAIGGSSPETVTPHLLLRGRNFFKLALSASIHSKKTSHEVSYSIGAQQSLTANLIALRIPLHSNTKNVCTDSIPVTGGNP